MQQSDNLKLEIEEVNRQKPAYTATTTTGLLEIILFDDVRCINALELNDVYKSVRYNELQLYH